MFKFVVVVQDGLPPRGGVLPARAGECCIFTSRMGYRQGAGSYLPEPGSVAFLPAQPTRPSASGRDIVGCGLVVAVSGKMAAHY